MSNKIDTILHDLYALDPQFKKHEAELRKIVNLLLKSEPNTAFDAFFAHKLRKEVIAQFEKNVEEKKKRALLSPYFSFSTIFASSRTWAPLALIVLLLPFSYKGIHDLIISHRNASFSVEQQISDKGAEAFGTLSVPSVAKNTKVALLPELSPTNAPQGVSALSAPLVETPQTSVGKASIAVTPMSMSMQKTTLAPQSSEVGNGQVSYEYTGEPLLLEDKGKVYKRSVEGDASNDLSSIVQSFNIDALNLNQFKNLKPRTLELVENSNLGYVIDVDFAQGFITINPDWPKWNETFNDAGTYAVPDDRTLISISNQFLKEHGINTELYGTPSVIHRGNDAAGTMVSANDTLTVVYPITIDGLTVYDENALPYGLNVTINIKVKKVESVVNLTSQKYESASYNLLNDANAVLREATSSPATTDTKSETKSLLNSRVTVTLKTPIRVLLKTWKDEGAGTGIDIYVPALLFNVATNGTSTPAHGVIVPLTKDAVK